MIHSYNITTFYRSLLRIIRVGSSKKFCIVALEYRLNLPESKGIVDIFKHPFHIFIDHARMVSVKCHGILNDDQNRTLSMRFHHL